MVSVTTRVRLYRYLGPVELKELVRAGGEGQSMCSSLDFGEWASA